MEKVYKKTNIYLIDEDVWRMAKFKARYLNHRSVSDYIFSLIKKDLGDDLKTMRNFLKVDEEKDVP